MKLFAKYNRINVVSTVIIFLLGCLAFALLLRYVIINQIDEDLKIEKNEVISYVTRFNHLPAIIEVHDQYTTFTLIKQPSGEIGKIFTNTISNEHTHKKELRRTIEFNISVGNSWYLVSVSKSLQGTDKLIQTIIAITITIILLILIVTFIINRIVLKKLWQPFYSTLSAMQQFNLSDKQEVSFNNTNIDEFNYLNSTLNNALSKAQNDYQSLKEFTENASHELQTPLAVIQSKLDILIQNEKLSEAESKNIQGAYDAVQNLKKLNQSLLLLAKIENNQFGEQTEVNLAEAIHNKINQFTELWKNLCITTETNIKPATVMGNMQLMDILLNNLLSNATKHNCQQGNIFVNLQQERLIISNTGDATAIDGKILFRRFSKANISSEGYGLGLSIVKQICNASGFAYSYKYSLPRMHSFIINFNNNEPEVY